MPWLKNSDDGDDDPLILSLCTRRSDRYVYLGVMHSLRLYAARHLTDGFLPGAVVNEVPRRVLTKLTARTDGAPNLIHSRGDTCECMKELEWPVAASFYVHGYLDDNPTKAEHDLRKAKRAECADAELRRQAMTRDGGHCRYCDRKVNAFKDHTSDLGAVLDHVDPMRAIGITNLVLACRGCNSQKGNRTPEQAGMPLLQARSERPSSAPSKAASNSLSNSSSSSSATAQATASTTPRGGLDGTGRVPGLIRAGPDNPYDRNQPDPDHFAGLALETWPPGTTKNRPPGQKRASPEQLINGHPDAPAEHPPERRTQA